MSAKVAAQKFSFPFSSAARLSQDELSQKGCIQVKALTLQDLQEGPAPPPGARPGSSQGGVKPAADGEDQRPAAKRQLSSESAARTITAVKKSAVRAEAEESKQPKPRTHPGQRGSAEKRRRRKDLFASSDVFQRIDSHAVRAGAEVTPPRHPPPTEQHQNKYHMLTTLASLS